MHEVPDAVQEPAGRDQVAAEVGVDRQSFQCEPAEEHRAAGLDTEDGPPVRCPPDGSPQQEDRGEADEDR